MAGGAVDAVPACPAAPDATIRFCEFRWGVTVDIGRWAGVLSRRERVVRGLRAAGDARAADAAGWLGLVGLLCHLPSRMIGRVLSHGDPGQFANDLATMSGGSIGSFRRAGDQPPGRFTTDDGLEVVDAGSRAAWSIADLAGRSAHGDVVVLEGHPLTPSTFQRVLRQRTEAVLGGRGI